MILFMLRTAMGRFASAKQKFWKSGAFFPHSLLCGGKCPPCFLSSLGSGQPGGVPAPAPQAHQTSQQELSLHPEE